MSDRYFAKVAVVRDGYTIVIGKGSDHGVKEGDKFLVIGLGEVIVDPDTGDELERLEMVRGKAKAVHVQSKVTTLESCEYFKSSDTREIKKVTSRGTTIIAGLGSHDTVTESIKPGETTLKKFDGVEIGDRVIRLYQI